MVDNTNRVIPRRFSTMNPGQSVGDIIESIQAYTQSLFAPLPNNTGSINNTGNMGNIGIDNTGFNWGVPQADNNAFMSGVLPAGQGVLQNMGDGNIAPTSPQTMGGGLNDLFPAPLQSSYVNNGRQQQQVPQGSQVNAQGGGNVGAPSALQNILNSGSSQIQPSNNLGIDSNFMAPNFNADTSLFDIDNPTDLDAAESGGFGSDLSSKDMFNMFYGAAGLGLGIRGQNKQFDFMEDSIGIAKDKLGLVQRESKITNQRRGFV